VSDVVVTIRRSASLDEVVETMFEREISSLVVLEDESDEPIGVVTKTDVLEALTWEQEDRNAVQVFGLDLLDGMDYDGVSALIENMTSKYGDMSVIKASIELHEHKEQSRGMPLVLARIRLVTDRGYFTQPMGGIRCLARSQTGREQSRAANTQGENIPAVEKAS